MKLSELSPNPKNPRRITDAELLSLKASIEEFGDLSGVFFNRRTKRLGGGHQRVKVLPKDAEVSLTTEYEAPTKTGTIAEGHIEAHGEKFLFRVVDWDEEREMAANLAANKHGGNWDETLLAQTLQKLTHEMQALSGFTEHEVQQLLSKLQTQNEGLTDPDVVPKAPKVAKTQRGELWLLGNHRLLCGDATNVEDVARLMKGEKADIVFTDPPYGINLDPTRLAGNKPGFKRIDHDFTKIHGDGAEFDPSHLLSMECDEMFIFGANNFSNKMPKGGWICWDKKITELADRSLVGDFELCWSKKVHKFSMVRVVWNGVTGHVRSLDGETKVHPSQKPIKLILEFLSRWGAKAQTVWDGYLGSGSTLIACEKTDRHCFGMEIEPIYIDVILERWTNFTGKEPKREDGTPWSYVRDGGD